MTDIMELINQYIDKCIQIHEYDLDNWPKTRIIRQESNELLSQLESRIQAIQEVCDAAVLYNNGVMQICEFSNVVDGYTEAIKK